MLYVQCLKKDIGKDMYLIIGGNGYLGNYIIKSVLKLTSDDIVATARSISGLENSARIRWVRCDITNEKEFDELIASLESRNDVKVVFLAAYHHPDLVAANPKLAWDINVTTLSKCINKLGFAKRLFYASTDSVYGNSINGYHFKESDPLNPVNTYGHNKVAAESIVTNYGFNVVRYPFLIAPSLVPGKKHFYDSIVESLRQGMAVEMFEDSFRSSLGFAQAADMLIRVIEMEGGLPSILNICGDEDLSKYDVGLRIADKTGYDRSMIIPIRVKDAEGIFKSPRAMSTLMDNQMIKDLLGLQHIFFEL